MLGELGYPLAYSYVDRARVGDHICYISDIRKVRSHFPELTVAYDVSRIVQELVAKGRRKRLPHQ